MARSSIIDRLQTHRFWLTDISIIDPLSLPILNPLLGFSSITAPELTSEVIEITEGNWYFKSKMVGRAGIGSITLTRGATVYDNDFYNWIIHTITGESQALLNKLATKLNPGNNFINPTPRKDLLLLQFFSRNPFATVTQAAASLSVGINQKDGGGDLDLLNRREIRVESAANFFNFSRNDLVPEAATFSPPSPIEFIPARVFILYNCLPSRYKASSDFNAKSADISLMELTLEVEGFEELTLGGTSLGD